MILECRGQLPPGGMVVGIIYKRFGHRHCIYDVRDAGIGDPRGVAGRPAAVAGDYIKRWCPEDRGFQTGGAACVDQNGAGRYPSEMVAIFNDLDPIVVS